MATVLHCTVSPGTRNLKHSMPTVLPAYLELGFGLIYILLVTRLKMATWTGTKAYYIGTKSHMIMSENQTPGVVQLGNRSD